MTAAASKMVSAGWIRRSTGPHEFPAYQSLSMLLRAPIVRRRQPDPPDYILTKSTDLTCILRTDLARRRA